MRYIWAFVAYLALLTAAVTSCGGVGNGNVGSGPGGNTGSGTQGTGTGNSASTAMGGGGSSGIGLVTSSGTGTSGTAGGGPTCPNATTCAAQNANCGSIPDGCGGMLDCGTCATGTTCSTSNVCVCKPSTCTSLGYNCGMTGDGCGGTLDCGTCTGTDTCGANNMPNVCGTGSVCMPATCASLNYNCGSAGNGCGGALDCGTCTGSNTCGGGGKPNVCGSSCVPETCASLNYNCGATSNGCGGTLNCGTCTAGQTCGATSPNVCGAGTVCTGLCLQQMTCSNPAVTTTLTGTVYAPNGTDPLTTALVYIPNAPVQAFPCGVTCGACSASVSGSPLVSAVTGINGQFTLTNVPVGNNIPLVIQLGRWRRQVTLNVPACVTTAVPANLTNMPNCRTGNAAASCAGKAFGDIPLMAFATGSVDGLECIMHKIGVDVSEFTKPAANCGGGRIQLYTGITSDGFGDSYGGATIGGTGTPTEDKLWSTQATLNDYDMVLLPCQGAENDSVPDQGVKNLSTYTNAGGRVFGTHYSYNWFTNVNPSSNLTYPWAATAAWAPDSGLVNAPSGLGAMDVFPFFITLFGNPVGGETAYINLTAGTDSDTLAQWLLQPAIGASTTLGQIPIYELRHDFDSVVAPSLLWMNLKNDDTAGNAPMHYTFNTPVGAAPANQCGKVVYDDFHVEDIEYNDPVVTTTTPFPQECSFTACTTSAQCTANAAYGPGSTCTGKLCMSPQEKLLEFMLFDLASCVPSTTGGCVPKTCAELGNPCGQQGDGCGNLITCAACGPGETCGGGGTPNVCGMPMCTPTTCAALGNPCGQQGDGCGGLLTCATCAAGQTCGGGGPGKCGTNTCTPKTCAQLEFSCGMEGDGCGNLLNCGTCSNNQTCGGGGTPGQCGNSCVPKTCVELNATCGSIGNGCGGMLSCGTCVAPLSCGFNTPNQCGGNAG